MHDGMVRTQAEGTKITGDSSAEERNIHKRKLGELLQNVRFFVLTVQGEIRAAPTVLSHLIQQA